MLDGFRIAGARGGGGHEAHEIQPLNEISAACPLFTRYSIHTARQVIEYINTPVSTFDGT